MEIQPCLYRRMDRWMNGWMDELMNGINSIASRAEGEACMQRSHFVEKWVVITHLGVKIERPTRRGKVEGSIDLKEEEKRGRDIH